MIPQRLCWSLWWSPLPHTLSIIFQQSIYISGPIIEELDRKACWDICQTNPLIWPIKPRLRSIFWNRAGYCSIIWSCIIWSQLEAFFIFLGWGSSAFDHPPHCIGHLDLFHCQVHQVQIRAVWTAYIYDIYNMYDIYDIYNIYIWYNWIEPILTEPRAGDSCCR